MTTLFDNFYLMALAALSDGALPAHERRRAASLVEHALCTWPWRWDDRIERELMEAAVACVSDTPTVVTLADMLLDPTRPSSNAPRLTTALLRLATMSGNDELLTKVVVRSCGIFGVVDVFDASLVERVARGCIAAGEHDDAAMVLSSWAAAHPQAAEWTSKISLNGEPTLDELYIDLAVPDTSNKVPPPEDRNGIVRQRGRVHMSSAVFCEGCTAIAQQGSLNERLEQIQRLVCEYYAIRQADLRSRRRHRSTSIPRMVASYLCRTHLALDFLSIGQAFGGRDVRTVKLGIGKIEFLVKNEDIDIVAAIRFVGARLGTLDWGQVALS